jgi:hypothetical protein
MRSADGWPPDFRGWIPGLPGFGVVLARCPQAVLTLTCPAAYPDALRLDLTLLLDPHPPEKSFLARSGPSAGDWLTLAIEWSDRSTTSWGTGSWHRGDLPRTGGYTLEAMSSDGGPDGIRWNLVLHPLPPSGSAMVTVTGDDFDREYISALDLSEAVAAADRAERWAR